LFLQKMEPDGDISVLSQEYLLKWTHILQ
jgi:hypothetical protein